MPRLRLSFLSAIVPLIAPCAKRSAEATGAGAVYGVGGPGVP